MTGLSDYLIKALWNGKNKKRLVKGKLVNRIQIPPPYG